MNIWEEAEGPEMIQFTPSVDPSINTVSAGTLNKLVVQLTNEKGEGSTQCTTAFYSSLTKEELLTTRILIDLDFVKTFLLTYQSFTTAFVLLRKLIER